MTLDGMTERASAWYAVPDLTDGFGSISFSYFPNDSRRAFVVMNGVRNLALEFTRVIALHFEDECPGNFPRPPELPKLRPGVTFPLLKIENSRWPTHWPMWPNLTHYFLVSSDDLVHLLAHPIVQARWECSRAA